MEKCLLIGASGFIGTNLVTYLEQQAMYCQTVNRKELYDLSQIDFDAVDTVIHTAGFAHDMKEETDNVRYYKANFELTKRLYDQFLASSAKKFIFISSVKAAADEVDGILTESAAPSPKTEYGRTKLMAEQYIFRQKLPQGKAFYILRPCLTHGKGNKGNLNLLNKIVNSGLPYPLAAFNNKRSFLSVSNLCFIIKEIVERDDIPVDIYNVADDQPLSTSEVFSILAESVHKKPRLWKIPAGLISGLARVCDILHLPLTTERLQKLTESYVVSNAKIKAALRKSLPISAVDGLRLTAGYLQEMI
jgi:nucleoside-diphosphate-sugar epimerase